MALQDYLSTAPYHPRRWLPGIAPAVPTPTNPTISGVPLPAVGPYEIPPPTEPMIGTTVRPGASRLEQLMAQRDALSQADVSSKVTRTPRGYEIGAPEQSPSRVRQTLIGALQGAAIAGQGGDVWATLGGAATGAAAGGISPRLMQAFTRQQELDRLAGNIATEQQVGLRNAQIYNTQMEPELKAATLQRQIDADAAREQDRQRRDADRDADRELRVTESRSRLEQADKTNKLRQSTLEETIRHNTAMENKQSSGSNTRTVANTIFERDEDGVWRVAPGAPPPMTSLDFRRQEKDEERSEKGRQAKALYQKGSEYWDQAKAKREEARKLGLGPDGNPSRVAAIRNEESIKQLNREAEKLEEKTREVQIQGDKLAAESESGPQSTGSSSGGRTIEGAVEAFKKAKGRAPTQDEINRMKKALGQ